MNKHLLLFIIVASVVKSKCNAQQAPQIPSPTPYTVTSRDANSRIWQSASYRLSAKGQLVSQTHSYTELATGLCYQKDGQWLDSQEQISILPDGTAEAVQGQHQAYFPNDIYSGTIKLVTSDELTLQSQPVGLSYDDGTNTVMIAVLTNSVGELISSNQVLYPNAFVGVDADLLYTYKKSGFEQDVIFRQQPPVPEQFGLSSSVSRLQLLTEFFNPPAPVETTGALSPENGLQDTSLTFGSMKMINGHAFLVNATGVQNNLRQLPVYKSWIDSDGRTFLIEELPYQRMSSQLATLPQMSASLIKPASPTLHKLSLKRTLPPKRIFAASNKPIQLAKVDPAQKPGFVFDYVTVNANETNFVFQGDLTYYLSSVDNLFGKTTIEGGTVIKMSDFFSNGQGMIDIDQNGTIDCRTAPYRPAVFTSMDDDTLGEKISGSTGSPSIDENNYYLMINSSSLNMHDCRFSYALLAIFEGGGPATVNITNCQFENTEVAVYAHTIGLYNVLIGVSASVQSQILSDNNGQIYLEGTNLIAENVTADSGAAFIQADNAHETMALTNCLITSESITNFDNGSTLLTNGVVYIPSPSSPVYDVVGGGNYYLTNGSPYRSKGNPNIDPVLLNNLAKRTTIPPVVYDATNISSLGTLNIAASRDTNAFPDIGYHYDPLDYAFAGCDLYNNLSVASGVAVAWFEDNGGVTILSGEPYGISFNDGANLSFQGNASNPCFLVPFRRVQEGGNANWSNIGSGYYLGMMFNGYFQIPQISANFTTFSATYGVNGFLDNGGNGAGIFNNCEFYDFATTEFNTEFWDCTNCLFFRTLVTFFDEGYDISFTFENCTFYNGALEVSRSGQNPSFWQAQNTSFDGTGFYWSDYYSGTSYTLFNNNAYNTNNLSWQTYPEYGGVPFAGNLEVIGPNDITNIDGYNWQSSWFGNFYLPPSSPLINAGSTTADQLGLYHFTTQTNQIPETNSTVDIGYHYVATDPYGNLLDSNGNGIPDYLEDSAGNGSGNWDNTMFLNVIISQPQNGSTLP